VRQVLCGGLFAGGHEHLESDQSPIDPMMGNEAAGIIHDFDKVNLIALRRCARILPGQLPAVGKERSDAIPARELVAQL